MISINIDGSLISSRQRSSDKDEVEEKGLAQEFEDLGVSLALWFKTNQNCENINLPFCVNITST